MKRLITLLLVLILTSTTAYAIELGDALGGLTEIFGSDDTVTYEVGETGTTDNVSATLNNVMEGTGNDYGKPADGNVYLYCEFTIENDTSESLVVSSMMCFSASCDGVIYGSDVMVTATAIQWGKHQIDGFLEPGKKMTGVVGFEVPKEWKDLEITYSPDWDSGSLTFVASR